jgi:LPXTG-motif cell wall-anchored protein
VGPGQTIPLDEAADVYVPDSATWRVLARGRECDQPNMAECSANEIGLNDDAGIAETKYTASAGGVAGEHTVAAVSDHCANVGQPSCFLLTYRIDDLGAGAAAAAELPRGTLPATGQRGWPLAGLGLLVLALFLRRRVPST